VLEVSDRLLAKFPTSQTAFQSGFHALEQLKRLDEARKRAQARLDAIPNDRVALTTLGRAAVDSGNYAAAADYFAKTVASSEALPNDYNEHAWLALFAKGDLEKAVDEARRASSLQPQNYAFLNTLATLYAEQGRSAEARDMLLKSLVAFGDEDVRGADWYVVGRIAENYGINDIAKDAYGRVTKPENPAERVSAWELAQTRLAKMGK